MPQGLEVYNSSGVLTFSTADYLARICGIIFTDQTAGSVNIPLLATGQAFAFWFSYGDHAYYGQAYVRCVPQISGSTLSWSFPNDEGVPSNRNSGYIIYGLMS